VVFTELGYNRSHRAAHEPWEHHSDGDDAEALQLLCLERALETIDAQTRLLGAYLWKWFPGSRMPRDFQMQQPAVRTTLERLWRDPQAPAAAR
jgi:hypothetical protein